jgi:hypothetical protein
MSQGDIERQQRHVDIILAKVILCVNVCILANGRFMSTIGHTKRHIFTPYFRSNVCVLGGVELLALTITW